MMRKVALLAVVLGVSIASIPEASAAVNVKLTGSVYYLTDDMNGSFKLGDAAEAWFTYDPEAPGEAWYPGGVLDPTVQFYRHAPQDGGMQIGSYKVSFSNAARMFVTNDEASSHGPIDRVLFDDFGAQGAAVAGRPLDVVSISFQDDTATALNNLALPTSASTFAAFPGARASLDWQPYIGAEHRISIAFDSVSISAVPEPATWLMMIGGLGIVGWSMRRRKSRPENATGHLAMSITG